MEQVASEPKNPYRDDFLVGLRSRRNEPVWLLERRQAALAAFERLGLPGKRWEAWRNLDLTPIADNRFPLLHTWGEIDDATVEAALGDVPDVYRMVFVDGFVSAGHSALEGLPSGAVVLSLDEAMDAENPALERLGQAERTQQEPFLALNTAFMGDVALIHLGKGVVLDKPVVIVNLMSTKAEGRGVYPRTLVVAEEGAQASVVELFRSNTADAYLNVPVTEFYLDANAHISNYRVQEEGGEAFHLATVLARLERDATFTLHTLAVGGKTARTDIHVDLEGKGAEAELDGLYLAGDGQYVDHHTWVHHNTEHCNSRQRFKGVLDGKSETVFDGLVRVAPGAQKTDARQENRNLVLSPRGLAHSNPRLEIHADDVKCSHGSTTGELDREALFYMRARGIGERDAQALLTFAFVNEMLDTVRLEALKEYERELILRWLPGDETVREIQ